VGGRRMLPTAALSSTRATGLARRAARAAVARVVEEHDLSKRWQCAVLSGGSGALVTTQKQPCRHNPPFLPGSRRARPEGRRSHVIDRSGP
jgi:hypothetical protein